MGDHTWGVYNPLNYSVKLGEFTTADYYAVSIGAYANAYADGVAVGTSSFADEDCIAVGMYSNAEFNSAAMGLGANAYTISLAFGNLAYAVSDSISVGHAAYSADASVALGNNSRAEYNSIAIGRGTVATYSISGAIGPIIGKGLNTYATDSDRLTVGYSELEVGHPASSDPSSLRLRDSLGVFRNIGITSIGGNPILAGVIPDEGPITAYSVNVTASLYQRIAMNTSFAARTLTLPANPPAGSWVEIWDAVGTFGANNLTIARNGQNIMGLAQDMIVDVPNVVFKLTFTSFRGWVIS